MGDSIVYVCPGCGSEYASPGKCTKCGKKLVEEKSLKNEKDKDDEPER